MTRSQLVAIPLILLGLALFIVSLLWPLLVKPETVWSREQGLEQAKASSQLHRRTHEAAHAEISTSSDAKKAEARRLKEESQQRFDRSRAALQRAQSIRTRTPLVLRVLGLVLLIAGVGVHYAYSSNDEGKSSSRRGR